MMYKRLSTFGLALTLSLSSIAAQAYETLDAIKIIVNKDVITLNEYNQRFEETKVNLRNQGQNVPEEEMAKEVENQLILESLQLQIAERSGLRISSQQLTEAVNDIARRNKITLPELKAKLESEGQNYQMFRDRIRKDMMIQQVQQGHLRSQVTISEKEVDDFLQTANGKALTEEAYDVSYLTYPLSSSASDEAIEQAKQALLQLRQELKNNPAQIRAYINGKELNGATISGKNLGRAPIDQFPSLFAEELPGLSTGDISDPLRSGAGWHLVIVNQKIGGIQMEYQVHAKHILIKPSAVRTDGQAEKLANQLYQRLQDGEDFALLAKEYSEDPGSALQGGDLGWSNPNNYVPAFIDALKALKPGETSKPFKSSFGWHIVNKIDERDYDITKEQQRNKARNILGQRQFNEALEAWLNKLKGEAYIEIKR